MAERSACDGFYQVCHPKTGVKVWFECPELGGHSLRSSSPARSGMASRAAIERRLVVAVPFAVEDKLALVAQMADWQHLRSGASAQSTAPFAVPTKSSSPSAEATYAAASTRSPRPAQPRPSRSAASRSSTRSSRRSAAAPPTSVAPCGCSAALPWSRACAGSWRPSSRAPAARASSPRRSATR